MSIYFFNFFDKIEPFQGFGKGEIAAFYVLKPTLDALNFFCRKLGKCSVEKKRG